MYQQFYEVVQWKPLALRLRGTLSCDYRPDKGAQGGHLTVTGEHAVIDTEASAAMAKGCLHITGGLTAMRIDGPGMLHVLNDTVRPQ